MCIEQTVSFKNKMNKEDCNSIINDLQNTGAFTTF